MPSYTESATIRAIVQCATASAREGTCGKHWHETLHLRQHTSHHLQRQDNIFVAAQGIIIQLSMVLTEVVSCIDFHHGREAGGRGGEGVGKCLADAMYADCCIGCSYVTPVWHETPLVDSDACTSLWSQH